MLGNAPIHTQIPVEDLARARKFYEEKLGLKAVRDEMPGVLFLEAGENTSIMLYQRARTLADHTVAGFVVEDIDGTVKALAARGITFEQYDLPGGIRTNELGIASMGPARAAWFKDTEGNILALANKL